MIRPFFLNVIVMGKTMRILLLLLSFSGLWAAATGTLSGHISDLHSQDALPGVNILIDGTRLGAAADENGLFTIEDVPVGEYRLHIRLAIKPELFARFGCWQIRLQTWISNWKLFPLKWGQLQLLATDGIWRRNA